MRRIRYSNVAEADLLSLDKPVRERILKFFRERVAYHPTPKQLAEPLEGDLHGLWRFRVGDYRAVCDLQEDMLVVLVLYIDHRSRVYKRRTVPNLVNEREQNATEQNGAIPDESQESLNEDT